MDAHVEWLCNKIAGDTYVTRSEEDPLLSKIMEMEIQRRGWSVRLEEVKALDELKRSITQNLGHFWQRLLGDAPGWRDLGKGHTSGCDLLHAEENIVIELKNKYNTMNASSKVQTIRKLECMTAKGYTGYIGFIITEQGTEGYERTIKGSDVRILGGSALFRAIYGYDTDKKREACLAIDAFYDRQLVHALVTSLMKRAVAYTDMCDAFCELTV